MFDLLIKEAFLPDGRGPVNIAIKDGIIAAIGQNILQEAGEVIDAKGQLVAPPFVDPHFHMDATLSLGLPRMNQSGTLLEGIALWGELKPTLTVDAVVERALRYCDLAVAQGLLSIRSHVDVSTAPLTGVEALLEVRKAVAPSGPKGPKKTCCARWIWVSTWWVASRILNARWKMVRGR
jgi:cytosine deaminase